jgi:hypothetical protein
MGHSSCCRDGVVLLRVLFNCGEFAAIRIRVKTEYPCGAAAHAAAAAAAAPATAARLAPTLFTSHGPDGVGNGSLYRLEADRYP